MRTFKPWNEINTMPIPTALPRNARRGSRRRGMMGNSKLPLEAEKELARRRHNGESLRILSKEFGISQSGVTFIYRKRCPDHISFQAKSRNASLVIRAHDAISYMCKHNRHQDCAKRNCLCTTCRHGFPL
jgi:hypothetical protein